MNKLLHLFYKYKEVLLYLFFGVLTTIVSFVSFYFSSEIFKIHYLISNVISWIFAVGFAYVTNRIWVFESKTKGIKSFTQIIVVILNYVFSKLIIFKENKD